MMKHRWLKLLYTDYVVNTAREGVFLASYFYTYEGMREEFIHNINIPTQIAVPVSGGLAGALSWFVSLPLDCIKAGIQGQNIEKGVIPRINGLEVAKSLWKTKGFKSLYSGVTPTLIRAFLVSGSRFSAYEFALWMLRYRE